MSLPICCVLAIALIRDRVAQAPGVSPPARMSSLAAARADNFYHPPDWDPRKKSRAEHNVGVTKKEDKWKAHPLRERAKKLGEGILLLEERQGGSRCL